MNKEEIAKHNLATAIKKAALDKDAKALAKAAQAIFDAGYELEEMKITPHFLEAIMSSLIKIGWVPLSPDETASK